MQRLEAKTIQGMISGSGGKDQQAVPVHSSQPFCSIDPVFIFHINIQKSQVKPFSLGFGQKSTAGVKF